MATDEIRLVLSRDVVGPDGAIGEERVRREGSAYSPRTSLRRALTDRALKGFTDSDESALWLVEILGEESDVSGLVVGVSSKSSGLLLGPRKRDRLADLSADRHRLVVHFRYADQSEPVNNVFKQIFGAVRGRS